MKQKLQFLNFHFYHIRQILVALFICNAITIAQESIPNYDFPVVSTIFDTISTNTALLDSFEVTGFNTISQRADVFTKERLQNYNLIAVNIREKEEYIAHYTTAYYSKWEAEQNQTNAERVGVKHKDGQPAYWQDTDEDSVLCWSSIDVTSPGDSLFYGPHYHQEKWYRRWLYAGADTSKMNGIYDVRYIPRWRMALDTTNSNLESDEDVCRLSVWVRNVLVINGNQDSIFNNLLKESRTLKVSDFPANGQFKPFYLSDNPPERSYSYPKEFQTAGDYYKLKYPDIPETSDSVYEDIYGNNGVEFRIEWLRSDEKCTLYVDYVEVYDDYGWRDYIERPVETSNKIKAFADSFKTMDWANINNWIGATEPFSIDSYIPIRTVDSLLRDNDSPPLMVQVWPYWNIMINSDSMLVRYYRTAKPDPLAIHFFPFNSWNVPSSYGDWEAYRKQLQISYTLTRNKGFWYQAQNFGFELPGGGWLGYRQPDSSEHKAEIMLALAHGIKGLVFAHYDSYPQTGYILQGW